MLLPVYKNPEYKVGDIVISLSSIYKEYYYFTPYHEFVIVSVSDNYNAIIRDVNSNIEFKALLIKDFLLKIDLNSAKNRHIEVLDYQHFKSFIHKRCPHLYEGIDDREYYDACRINKNKDCLSSCKIVDDCVYHIDKKELKNDKIVVRYLRRKKIKNIIK